MQFPPGFLWGCATASYQVEGAAKEDGRGESIWDRFCATPGKVLNGDTGDVACDHYHRLDEDVQLMAALGLKAYRFSIAWPRLFPQGSGELNRKGVDFYRRLAEKLLENHIRPVATLYHWDLPQALEDRGGWPARETADRFAEYAEAAFRELGDLVPLWITLNEPWVSAFAGYLQGRHAPGRQDLGLALRAAHHLLLGHGLAVQAFRALGRKESQIGVTLNLTPQYPAGDAPADAAAARLADGHHNRWFLDPVLTGHYPQDMLSLYTSRTGELDCITPGDLPVIGAPIDFLGVNYYSRGLVRAEADSRFGWAGARQVAPLTDMGWEIVPDCLYDLLTRLKADYGDIPLYITENGAAFQDAIGADGAVADADRAAFLEAHFAAAHRAIAAGVNLNGYFVWSLMDNFEWAWGYSKRFGIVYVDYQTLKRTPKQSYYQYQRIIQQNGL